MLPGLNKTLVFKSPTYTPDAPGFSEVADDGWTVEATVAGSLQPAKGTVIEKFGRRGINVTHVFYSRTEVPAVLGWIATHLNKTYLCRTHDDQAGQGRIFAVYLDLPNMGTPDEEAS